MWITPNPAEIRDSLPDSEADLYTSFEGDEDGTAEDRLPGIIARAVMQIRSRVSACKDNVMDPDTATIPPECEDALLAIVRHRLISRIDAEEDSSRSGRTREYNDALKFLDQVAACAAAVEKGASTASSGVSLVSSRKRVARRENLGGLL